MPRWFKKQRSNNAFRFPVNNLALYAWMKRFCPDRCTLENAEEMLRRGYEMSGKNKDKHYARMIRRNQVRVTATQKFEQDNEFTKGADILGAEITGISEEVITEALSTLWDNPAGFY